MKKSAIKQLVILFNEYRNQWKELTLWTTFLKIILVASSSEAAFHSRLFVLQQDHEKR